MTRLTTMITLFLGRRPGLQVLAPACLCLVVAACGSSPSDPSTPDAASPVAGGGATGSSGADGSSVVGAFNLTLTAATDSKAASTSLSGVVFDGPTPANIAWDITGQSGGCVLSKARAPFCDPSCTGGDVCVAAGRCMRQPVAQDVGLVKVRGLGAGEITLEGISNVYDLPIGLDLPFPPAAEGAEVELVVASGPYGPFSIKAKGVAPLASPGNFTMERGKAMSVTWSPPGQPQAARIRVLVDISHHGGTKGKIECEGPDNGSLEIPANLVSGLIGLGVAGFPKVQLDRFSAGTAAVSAGIVKFEAASSLVLPIKIVGYTSCDSNADCAPGKVCQPDALCQP
jgi:hypothetical protein